VNTIPAREIKRRGISAVDELLENGPVHVIKEDRPTYVVMDEERYYSLLYEIS
jgi:PHD/YefM family antitoxin component YafN of YafNO toxin-antitoxin module